MKLLRRNNKVLDSTGNVELPTSSPSSTASNQALLPERQGSTASSIASLQPAGSLEAPLHRMDSGTQGRAARSLIRAKSSRLRASHSAAPDGDGQDISLAEEGGEPAAEDAAALQRQQLLDKLPEWAQPKAQTARVAFVRGHYHHELFDLRETTAAGGAWACVPCSHDTCGNCCCQAVCSPPPWPASEVQMYGRCQPVLCNCGHQQQHLSACCEAGRHDCCLPDFESAAGHMGVCPCQPWFTPVNH